MSNQYLSGGQCLLCDPNCLSCEGTATYCTSCSVGKGWLDNVCYTTCPGKFYLNPPNCTSCNVACVNCNGGTSSNCISCTNNKYL